FLLKVNQILASTLSCLEKLSSFGRFGRDDRHRTLGFFYYEKFGHVVSVIWKKKLLAYILIGGYQRNPLFLLHARGFRLPPACDFFCLGYPNSIMRFNVCNYPLKRLACGRPACHEGMHCQAVKRAF